MKNKKNDKKLGSNPVIEEELNKLFSPEWLRKTAKETGLIKRLRKVDPVLIFWVLTLGFGVQLQRTLASLHREYEEKEVMRRIRRFARNMKETNLLMSTPGIAEFSSLMILAEIGDIRRFKSPKELVSYAGLCLGIYQTGSTERTVRNNAVNKWLKWIIYECSGKAILLDHRFQKYFSKVQQRKGYQTGRRAAARKMLTIIWHMLTYGEPYRAS